MVIFNTWREHSLVSRTVESRLAYFPELLLKIFQLWLNYWKFTCGEVIMNALGFLFLKLNAGCYQWQSNNK
jgi:hypothetical protein